jgi:RecA/RadA recombinase
MIAKAMDANEMLRTGEDLLREHLDRARQPFVSEPSILLPDGTSAAALEYDHEIKVETRVDAVVKGILHLGDVATVYGPSSVGKTFLVLDLAYHVALGRYWHGLSTKKAAVLYVGLEGVRGVRHRMAANARSFEPAGFMLARLKLLPVLNRSDLGDKGEATIIRQAHLLAQCSHHRVGLIIIDTTARAMAGDDENSARDMGAYIARLHAIARATGAAVLSVHHTGKDETRGMRGSSALIAACDTVIKITRDKGIREVVAEKVKDGAGGKLFSYRLELIQLDVDDDGDAIVSCIVKRTAPGGQPARRPVPGSQASRALEELEELVIDDRGEKAHAHPRAPEGAILVKVDVWRSQCRRKHLSDGDSDNEKKAFQRAFQKLSALGTIGSYDGDVWLVRIKKDAPASRRDSGPVPEEYPGDLGDTPGPLEDMSPMAMGEDGDTPL